MAGEGYEVKNERIKIPQTPQDVVSEIDKKYDQEKFRRTYFESNWYLNLAFYLGYQWVQYNYDYRGLTGVTSPSWRVKHVSNFILPTIRIVKAKILRSEPIAHVLPRKKETASQDNAQLCTKAIHYQENRLEMFNMLHRLYDSVLILADGYFKPYFNPNAGNRHYIWDWQFEPNDKPMIDEQGTHLQTKEGKLLYHKLNADGEPMIKIYHDGEIELDVVTPDEIYVDPFAIEHKDLKWIMQVKTRSLQEIKDNYGVTLKEEQHTLQPVGFEYQLGNLLGRKQDQRYKGMCVVKEYWEAPSDLFPNGRVVTTANNQLLQYIEIPPCYRKLNPPFPFIKFGYVTVPKRYYSSTPLNDARPIQRRYNKVMSRLIEHIDLMSAGKWMVDSQSQIPKGYINGETGQVVHYLGRQGVREPHQAQMASIPNYVIVVLNMMKQDLQEIFGIHEVSHGRTPKGVRSGTAIASLAEMDDTQLEPVLDNFKMGYAQTCKTLLYLMKDYYEDDRTISIVGKDHVEFISDFKGSDLDVDVDVICEIDSSLPDNKLVREQMVVERFKENLISRKEARSALEIEGEDIGKNRLDEGKAQLENEAMLKGIKCVPESTENPLVHMRIHNEAMQAISFEQQAPEIKRMFQEHYVGHDKIMASGLLPTDVKLAVAEMMGDVMAKPKGKGK